MEANRSRVRWRWAEFERTRGAARTGVRVGVLLLLSACGGERSPVELDPQDTPLPLLGAGTWFLHEVDGQSLPGVVVTGSPGSGLESLQVDSAHFVVAANGTLVYRSWTVHIRTDGTAWNVTGGAVGQVSPGPDAYTVTLGGHVAMMLTPAEAGSLAGEGILSPELGDVAVPVVFRPVPPPSSNP